MSDNVPPIPDDIVRKATNLIRDARLAAAVGLIPLLGLIFILRLVQWYLLKGDCPALLTDTGEQANLSKEFRSALPRLWFAVLLWPAMFVFILLAFKFS